MTATPRFSLADAVNEVVVGLTARPGRTILTALGTVLGVGALVVTLGLAKTAGGQIVARFDKLAETQVTIEPKESQGQGSQQQSPSAIPWDAQDRIERLNGVRAAGTTTDINMNGRLVRTVPVVDPSGQSERQVPMIAASPGLFDAAISTLQTGRHFDTGHDKNARPVAVLGPGAAEDLNINQVRNSPTVFIGDEAITVIGILATTERLPELLNAIIVPNQYAKARFGASAPGKVLIDVDVGAAELLATQAPTALSPNNPELLQARAPRPVDDITADVEGDVNSLFLALGGVSLLAGALGIANVTLVSVLERTGEIGLRRALGATRIHIASQFMAESVALGLLAGLLGTCFGVITIVAVSASRQWTPVLDPWLPVAAPMLGAAVGIIAGMYPALKASSIEPIAALRSNN